MGQRSLRGSTEGAQDSGLAAGYGSLTESAPSLPQTVSPVITLNPALAPRVDLDEKEILLDTTLICVGTECLGEAARFQESRIDTPSFSLRWDPLPRGQ